MSRVVGVLAEFTSEETLMEAARKVREEGYRRWDCHTPYPVHGLDQAMGVRHTVLPWLVMGGGLTGAACGMLMQWWMNAVDYPIMVSGKPLWSIPAFIPVTFECTVLFAALTSFFGMLALNGLPKFYQPLFRSQRFKRATSDRFFVYIEGSDAKCESENTPRFLESVGSTHVEVLHE